MTRSFPAPGHIAGRVAVVFVAFVLAVALTFIGTRLAEGPPPVNVRVDGRLRQFERGTTFGRLVRAEGLHAESGRLLDVEGDILQRRADPGEILLNGSRPPRTAVIVEGDRVEIVNGEDRTEPTVRTIDKLPRPVPLNPASVIGKAPSVRVTIEGKRSGKIVQQFTKPIGPVRRPNEVALTFDDGPWPGDTARILDVLKRFHVKATFFVVGYLAERYPMLVRREIRAGMTVANHSWSHPVEPPFRDFEPAKIEGEMSKPNGIIQRFDGPSRLFRPPGGSWDDEVRAIAEGLGMRLVLWDIDTFDWRSSTAPKQIAKRVLSQVRPGSIILMHDGGGDAAHTIKALPTIIKGIRKQHLKLVAL